MRTTRQRVSCLLPVAGLLAAGVLTPQAGATIFTIIGRDLEARTVDVVRISGGKIVYIANQPPARAGDPGAAKASSAPAAGGAASPGVQPVEQSIPMSAVVAIVEPGWWSGEVTSPSPRFASDRREARNQSVVELTDGRVITGKIAADAGGGTAGSGAGGGGGGDQTEDAEPPKDVLRWESPLLGPLEFRLEDVRRVRLPLTERADSPTGAPGGRAAVPAGGPVGEGPAGGNGAGGGRAAGDGPPEVDPGSLPPPAGPEKDSALLTNGDRVAGLVERIGRQVWVSEGQSLTKLPIALVREVQLVNPPVTPDGMMIWLQGGTVMRAEFIGADPRQGMLVGIEPARGKSRQAPIKADLVRAIVPAVEAVHALSSLPIAAQRPSAERPFGRTARVAEAPEALLGVRDIDLPGPMTIEWSLPADAARVAGWLTLPAAYQEWGDCVVRIEAGGGEPGSLDGAGWKSLASERVNRARPNVAVNAALPAGSARLRLTVESGEFGPVQDRILLRRFIVAGKGQ